MINFPKNPALGQKYSAGIKTWTFNGRAWELQSVSDSYVQRTEAAMTAAAASAATALKTLATEATDPPAAPIDGQEWTDATSGRRYTWNANSSCWAETYAALSVDNPVLVDLLSTALQLADYVALRAYSGVRQSVYVTGYLNTKAPAGIAGMFILDDSDMTSADNGGTIIVAANGKRWKREISNGIDAAWFGLDIGASAAVNAAAFNGACLAARRTGDGYQSASSGRVKVRNGVYKVSGTLSYYNGTYIDGESPGGVIFEQLNGTVSTLKNVDQATGIDQSATIKRIVIKYLVQSAAANTYGIEIASSTAIAPVLEDVVVFNANSGFNFKLTINLAMRRCYAINCFLDGFVFTDVNGGNNSAASINACYAAGCGQYGFSGTLIGSTLAGVCADRCATGFSLTLKNSTLSGSTESCTNFGAVLSGNSSMVQLYSVTANNAISGIYCTSASDIVFVTPRVDWGGGGTGYGFHVDVATCARLTIISPQIAAFGSGKKYNDTSRITFVGEFAPIVKSPDGTAYQINVSNAGALSATLA